MVGDDKFMIWEVEEIPNEHKLYKRVNTKNFHRNYDLNDLHPPVNIFRDTGSGMSVNWSKYADAQDTKDQARIPEDNWVIKMNVGKVREINELEVEHTPKPQYKNRAHSSVYGINKHKERNRIRLREISEYVIKFST